MPKVWSHLPRILPILLMLWFSLAVAREIPGVPQITYFPPEAYQEHAQNWEFIQDLRGVLYAANGNGVLEYDGVRWRIIETPDLARIRSFARDDSGKIYVGGSSELGFLRADSSGSLQFVSLTDQIPESERDFSEVWRTHVTPEGVYFQTFGKIFRWSRGRMQVWTREPHFFLSATVHGTFYVQQRQKGLFRMVGDSLHLLPGTEALANLGVADILPLDAQTLMICSRGGLFTYRDDRLQPFATEADPFIRQNTLSSAALLPNGDIALATYNAGLAVISRSGLLQFRLTREDGLPDNDIKSIYHDGESNLWLALNSGIARLRLPSAFTYLNEQQGLEGNVQALLRHQGILYAGTGQGVYYLSEKQTPRFMPVEGGEEQTFALLEARGRLLAGNNDGVFRINGSKAVKLRGLDYCVFSLHHYRKNPDWLLAGHQYGLSLFTDQNGRWTYSGEIEGINQEIRSIIEDEQGTLWLGTMLKGGFRVIPGDGDKVLSGARVLPVAEECVLTTGQMVLINNRLTLSTTTGLKYLDRKDLTLHPELAFGQEAAAADRLIYWAFPLSNGEVLFRVSEGKKGEYWLAEPDGANVYRLDRHRFRDMVPFGGLDAVWQDPDGTTWMGCTRGVVRYNPAWQSGTKEIPPPLIRNVLVRRPGGAQTLYGGAPTFSAPKPAMDPEGNAFQIEFALPAFQYESFNEYRYQLRGFDDHWSAWTRETRKDYTNLPAGDYRFVVEARNFYGRSSGEAGFAFSIASPWYFSWWALFLYALGAGWLVLGLIKLRVYQLELQQERLEDIIEERTAQVVDQRNQLEEQSRKLREMDELKSHFFANISHEFRTPLTLILGLISRLENNVLSREARTDLSVMRRNANRLLNLINQLLDLSRLEAGGEKLQATPGDIVWFVRRNFAGFSSLAQQKDIALTFNGAPLAQLGGQPGIEVYFDEPRLEKVFLNLFSNAVKFTPQGGQIAVDLTTGSDNEGNPAVQIRVCNSGAGIPAEKLPYLFDRFYQADSGDTRAFEGSGIGLALAREMVLLHHGAISVSSEENRETVFTVSLPLGKTHLREDEMARAAEPQQISETLPEPPEEAVAETAQAEDGDAAAAAADQMLVLVVEDNRDLRHFIRDSLREMPDFQVECAPDGKAGLDMALELIPDLVISDVMMPEMD
nr:ATP-binding protein [Calditrichia bacterium]